MDTHELPMLAALASILRWLEELATLLSGPLLTVGLGISIIDLLTDGALLAHMPTLLYAWAISQAIGVDAQLVGSAAKARAAVRLRQPWAVLGYVLLVAALAYVGFVAALVFGTQEAEGITTAAALGRLGMDGQSWLIQRSALAVGLVVLSGLMRYHAPAATSLEDERAKLERELTLEPLRQQVRARRALGAVGLGRQMLATATGREPQDAPDQPPTGPGSPAVAAPGRDNDELPDGTGRAVVHLARPDVRRAAAVRATRLRRARAEQVARVVAWLREDGALSRGEIARRLRCSASHAGRLKAEALALVTMPEQMAQ